MRLILLTTLAMMAFAANSILTRLAVDGGHIDPSGFGILRTLAGAAVLSILISVRGGPRPLFQHKRLLGGISLAAYMIGFSLAYLTLDAGLGALILFGVTQIAMFTYGVCKGSTPNMRQLSGAGIAFLGLLIALWPSSTGSTDLIGASFMIVAGIGWAAYTLLGRGGQDPLADTAASFLICLPILLVLLVGTGLQFGPIGVGLAILSGGVTSGLGYALWYSVLPKMESATAAVVQLSVPILAIIAGVLLLGESLTLSVFVSAVLVLCGIGWAASAQSVPKDRS